MSNIETPSTVDELDQGVADLGDALSRRLANTSLASSAVSNVLDMDAVDVTSLRQSTDSTTDGVDADDPKPPAPDPTDDAGTGAGVSAPPDTGEGAPLEGAGDGAVTASEPPPAPSTPATFKIDDHEYTADEIKKMQQFTDWGRGLSPEVAAAMAAIEAGQAAVVDPAEFARYSAWRAAQSSGRIDQQQREDDFLADLDPEQRAYINNLQQQNEQLRAATTGQQPPVDTAALRTQADQQVTEFNTASADWARARGLTPEQTEQLANFAIEHNMFNVFAEQEREYNPVNGQLLRNASMTSVTQKALNYALASDPDLATHVITDNTDRETRANADRLADSAVSRKKAIGGSMAASQSQATVTQQVDPRSLNRDEQKSAMSEFIAQQEGLPRSS